MPKPTVASVDQKIESHVDACSERYDAIDKRLYRIEFILIGASTGAASIIFSALWIDLYGIGYLGSIRSMSYSMVVVSTAISPALMGLLLDIGITLKIQFVIFATYTFICSIIFAILTPTLLIARSPPLKNL